MRLLFPYYIFTLFLSSLALASVTTLDSLSGSKPDKDTVVYFTDKVHISGGAIIIDSHNEIYNKISEIRNPSSPNPKNNPIKIAKPNKGKKEKFVIKKQSSILYHLRPLGIPDIIKKSITYSVHFITNSQYKIQNYSILKIVTFSINIFKNLHSFTFQLHEKKAYNQLDFSLAIRPPPSGFYV